MARAEITVERTDVANPNLDLQADEIAATVDGAQFRNDGKTRILVRNAGAGPHTITVVSQKTVLGLAVADAPFVVAADKWALIGPFPTDVFNVQSGADRGKAYLDASGTQTEVNYHAERN